MSPTHTRIGKLISELLQARMARLDSVTAVSRSTLWRIAGGSHDYMLSSLIEVAHALGYEVVINLRERQR